MSVSATTVSPVSVNPANVRYSLSLDLLGTARTGSLQLQRSEKRTDGVWMDDPHVGSARTVPLIASPAVDGIVALLPTLLGKMLSNVPSYTDFRLRAIGQLSTAGVLDVLIIIQLHTSAGWQVVQIPSLTAFLTANQDIAASINAAWDALDSAINAANAEEHWL